MNDSDLADRECEFPLTPRRELPHSAESEEHVIACCLIDGDNGENLKRAIEASVTPESFYFPANRLIFETLAGLPTPDLDLLVAELALRKQLDEVGGWPYLLQITSKIPTSAHVSYFIDKLKETETKRSIIREATRLVEHAYNGTGMTELIAHAEWAIRPLMAKTATAKDGFTVWGPAQFRAYEPAPNMNLIGDGYIRRKQLTTLIGPPGVGKSRLSFWMGVSHICGREFLGIPTSSGPAKWLFFGNENDPIRQKNDLDWFYRNLTAEERVKVDTNLFMHVIDKPEDGIITLADPDAFSRLCATLKRVAPDVVVFDPWGNMIEGNENDNEEVRRTLKLLLRAIGQNCPDAAIVVIHHARTGKAIAIEAGNNYSGGSLGRGSKALVSSARCELALWPGDSEDSSKLVLTCEKVNNVKKFEPKGLVFENGIYQLNEEFDLMAWREDIDGVRGGKILPLRDIIELVRAGVHRSSDIITRAESDFGVTRRTVQTRLSEACEAGYLARSVPSGTYTLGNKPFKG